MGIVKDPLRGRMIDLTLYRDVFEQTLKFHQKGIRKCVTIRNAIICLEYLLMNEFIMCNTLEEVKADFEASLFLSTHGYYKHSMNALRSALEVCFEGLFYHFHPKRYDDWLKGKKGRINIPTSFRSLGKKSIIFKDFDKKYNFFNEVYDDLYNQLSLFVHTQGQ